MHFSIVIRTRLRTFIGIGLRISAINLIALMTATALPAADLDTSKNLFFIKRSKNANEVHYDARVQNCGWSKPEVDYYWRELQEGPQVYKPILFFEKAAYGFDVDRLSNSEIKIRLKAFPERAITARLTQSTAGQCRVLTFIEIRGRTAELCSVYVYAEENFIGWPTVHYIDILGYSQDRQPVFERIPKTNRGRALLSSPPDDARWKSGAQTWGRH